MRETPKDREKGQAIAAELGLFYEGVQEGAGLQFTDPVTESTFYGNTLDEVKDSYKNLKARFSKFGYVWD